MFSKRRIKKHQKVGILNQKMLSTHLLLRQLAQVKNRKQYLHLNLKHSDIRKFIYIWERDI